MKLYTAILFSLFASATLAAPQFEAFSSLFNSAIGSLIPAPASAPSSSPSSSAAKPVVVDKQPNPLGCTAFVSDIKEGKFSLEPEGGSYSICFQTIPGTCGIKFDLSHLVTSSDEPLLIPAAAPGTFVQAGRSEGQETIINPESPALDKQDPFAPVATPVDSVPQFLPKETPLVPQEPELISQPKSDICENSLFFPPTSSSFGGKVICLDRVTEPSVLLVGTPHVVYANTRKGLEFTIPFSYLTSC